MGIISLSGLKPELIDGRYRTYKQFYSSIQIGMDRDEVMSLIDEHFPTTGPRLRPKVIESTDERLSFHMDPEGEREPNCEGISLNLQHGKVVYKFYSRD